MHEQRNLEQEEAAPDPDALWRRPVGPELGPVDVPQAAPAAPETDDSSSLITPRRRRIEPRVTATVGAGVVALGLLVAWAVSRSGAEPTPAEATGIAATTTVATTRSGTTTTAPSVTIVEQPEPVVTSTTVATTAFSWSTGTMQVDPRLEGLDIHIVAVRPGELLLFNTRDGGTASSYMRSDFRQAPYLDAGEDWIVVRHTDTGQTQLYSRLVPPVQIQMGEPTSTYRQPGTDLFWMTDAPAGQAPAQPALVVIGGPAVPVVQDDGPPQQTRLIEIDHEGNATGVTLQTSRRHVVLGADPAGGVVVMAPGGTYHLDDEGSFRLTPGDVIAISTNRALTVDCPEGLTACGPVVLDRATGATTPLVPVMPASIATRDATYEYASPTAFGFSTDRMQISPDDRYAPIVVSGARVSFGVIDMTTGDYTELSTTPQSALWWSPDSRRVMYLSDRRLLMYDFDTSAAFDVLPDYDNLWSFTVRE